MIKTKASKISLRTILIILLTAIVVLILLFSLSLFSSLFNKQIEIRKQTLLQSVMDAFAPKIESNVLEINKASIYFKCQAAMSKYTLAELVIHDSEGKIICNMNGDYKESPKGEITHKIYFDVQNTEVAGTIKMVYAFTDLVSFKNQFFVQLISFFGLFLLLSLLLIYIATRLISYPLTQFSNYLKTVNFEKTKIKNFEKTSHVVKELDLVFERFAEANRRLENYKKEIIEKAEKKAVTEIAQSVAHDIRAPLSALESSKDFLDKLNASERAIIVSAIQRMKDILDMLFSVCLNGTFNNRTPLTFLPILTLRRLAFEKQVSYKQKNIDISMLNNHNLYNVFCYGDLHEFEILVSHILENSIDAIQNIPHPKIQIDCINHENDFEISIQDNGIGIPENIKNKIFEKGFTSGKDSGNGLGLFYCKQFIENMNGSITVESKENHGTKFKLIIPKTPSPDWFCNEIHIQNQTSVFILDDDPLIHEQFQNKFKNYNINLKSFSSISEFQTFQKNKSFSKNSLFLIDYNLGSKSQNGLDIIKNLSSTSNCILVNNEVFNYDLILEIKKSKIKYLPKDFLKNVTVNYSDSIPKDKISVLVDDDPIVRKLWIHKAKKSGISLEVFVNFDSLLQQLEKFPKDTKFYIDSNLGENEPQKGEVLSKKLFDNGFQEIFLCTGYLNFNIQNYPWLKKTLKDKSPPW